MANEGKIFPDTYCQVQHQMLVTGLQLAILCAFDGRQGKILEINRDQDFIDEMLEGELKFLKSLDTDTPPPEEKAKKIEVSSHEQATLFNWIEASKQLKALERQEKELRETLLSLASDEKVVLLYEGHPIVKMTKVTRDGSVDWKAFCKDSGLDLGASEEYRKKPVSYYQLKAM
jgi:predicted phage-related endonuclease